MATTVKLSFNVHCRALKPGEAVHVCLADPGSSSYDASKSVALTRTAADGGDTPAPAAFTMWSSSKPLTVAWGVQLRYKYAVFLHGAFAYFEKLSSDDRRVVPSGKVSKFIRYSANAPIALALLLPHSESNTSSAVEAA